MTMMKSFILCSVSQWLNLTEWLITPMSVLTGPVSINFNDWTQHVSRYMKQPGNSKPERDVMSDPCQQSTQSVPTDETPQISTFPVHVKHNALHTCMVLANGHPTGHTASLSVCPCRVLTWKWKAQKNQVRIKDRGHLKRMVYTLHNHALSWFTYC